MTEADVIQPSASIASPGKGIRYIGNHVYAYSGKIAINNETVDFLDFISGAGYIVAKLTGGRNMKSSAETEVTIFFNNSAVFYSKWDNGAGQTLVIPMAATLPLIIPPQTHVKIQLENDAHDNISLVFTGRVYGAE